jgi:hypothetical protein
LDSDNVWKYLNNAQGNWRDIRDFIIREKANPDLFPFLALLTEKDLRDTPLNYLLDHLQNRASLTVKDGTPDDLIVPFILSPRVESELITPWRSYFQKTLDKNVRTTARNQVEKLVDLVAGRVKINNEDNYYDCPISPKGVYELGIADERSRNILFVALARSCGIAARSGFGSPQYYDNGEWKTVVFDKTKPAPSAANAPKGTLVIKNESKEEGRPNYSIAAFSDGDFRARGFGGGRGWGGGGRGAAENRGPSNQQTLDAGYYRLFSGLRDSDGSARITMQFFEIKSDETFDLTYRSPEIVTKIEVKGTLDMNTKVSAKNALSLKELSNGKGLAVCFLDPGKEPSKHILQDFPSVQNEIQQWGGGVLFIVPSDKVSEAFTPSAFKGLPNQTVWATDQDRVLLNTITQNLQVELIDNFPLTLYLSDKGDILYYNIGYKIGTGNDILKVIQLEKK